VFLGNELSRRELLTLRDIFMMGRTTDWLTARELLKADLISETSEGFLQLTAAGRQMLVRGSPTLWSAA
jgi:hypothetical protein